jgi:alcohol dehydrogenase class IV
MAHSLGGLLDLAHGECNAMLLEPVIAFNFPEAENRFYKISAALGLELKHPSPGEVESALLCRIRSLKEKVGILGTLGKKGVTASDIAELTRNALKDPCMVTNPRMPNTRDIETIYEKAL